MPVQTAPPMDLREVLSENRVVVCLGSGGVGKTTTSAAIGLRAALEGRRTLCLTIDPAKRLANSLGLAALHGEQQRVDPALFRAHGLAPVGELWAMMLDMKRTFDELVARNASSPEQRERILNNRIYQYVSTSLAGTQEYMAMEKLHDVRKDPRYDLIVLDTPPTTNALDFLDAPQKLVGAIDSPVMRWFVSQMDERRSFNLLGKGAAFVLRGLSKFTGVEFLEQVSEFVTGINDLFGGFRDRARAVYEDLRGKDVAFLIVTSPSPASVSEAVFFGRKLAEYGITPAGVVVNRVHPHLEPGHHVTAEELEPLLPAGLPAYDLLERMNRAAREQNALATRDREGVRRLREHIGYEMSYTEVPALDRDVHDLGALAEVSTYLLGPLPSA
jgi:anion-transporting  ArsA/GET3 family ATPase